MYGIVRSLVPTMAWHVCLAIDFAFCPGQRTKSCLWRGLANLILEGPQLSKHSECM